MLFVLTTGNCGPRPAPRDVLEPRSPAGFRALDSLFSASGWNYPQTVTGKTTIDVKQYRVRGRFELSTTAGGDLTFGFTGTMVFGGHREEVFLSYFDDTLRVLDRERGLYYQGEEVNALVAGGTGLHLDLAGVLQLVMLRIPDQDRFGSVAVSSGGEREITGRFDREDFRLEFAGGSIRKASWPVIVDGGSDDRLRIDYRWGLESSGEPELDELVVFLEGRRWRVKLEAD